MPNIAAFFDMDDTLLSFNSGPAWAMYLKQQGEIGWLDLVKSFTWGLGYKLSLLDLEALMIRLVAPLKGTREDVFRQKIEPFIAEKMIKAILPLAKERVESHQRLGHTLVLLSSALSYMAEPIGKLLKFDVVLSTHLNVEQGQFTGTCTLPICWGTGKVHYAERLAIQHGIDLNQSFFYTDSYTDLPMLLKVGNPCAVNPDPRLNMHAKKQGWNIERW